MSEAILKRFDDGFRRAREAAIPEANGMTLSTADANGRPVSRVVLLKEHDASGFVFYTNLTSRKGREIQANPRVCLAFWWRETAEQVIIEGAARQVTDAEADAYFATRPRGSQIGAWASDQSAPLAERQLFTDRIAALEAEYEGREVPRPPHWSGFRVEPDRIEFWYGREYRWHERIEYSASDDGWQRRMLYP
ncbi:MAG: pyridoxamine 5'-phosphate oxidase [Wenzhouxiangellaceae bacterium]|nr:pyridoxamine 5'-phosphate oxidase [Wenzhouxiangellaceae bacterium]